ncbi:hypothetical protein M9H77_10699 [Catharanthus roseus]|uniref:Uncharacterized protein n=1 Tax=Catharanthus roseus TaxID=4058 RepID=A0ACC0BCI6_CATRO|nr:hypothetical protein M9H77_10699 [Catharanthus roseus]
MQRGSSSSKLAAAVAIVVVICGCGEGAAAAVSCDADSLGILCADVVSGAGAGGVPPTKECCDEAIRQYDCFCGTHFKDPHAGSGFNSVANLILKACNLGIPFCD